MYSCYNGVSKESLCLLNLLHERNESEGHVGYVIREDPNISIRKYARALNMHRSSLHLFCTGLKLHPYKIQLVQELKPQDASQRLEFVNQVIERFSTFTNILFSDAAHFHLNEHVNK